ncbi:unnamed protein product [Mycena citricolor]|uniref:T6SS Phospholipase effector Tle1-like catalytic domain-containing protein n=1 Tax=Mycena citricolor TaxID=2018698 RepID=A0AAD2HVX5_9AGAR|nr:unnamed protein product [Mycena citricolor]
MTSMVSSRDTMVPESPPQSPGSATQSKIVPPDHPFRTLVLCFDGTGDQFDSDNSNIVQLFSMLPKGDRERQMVYYQAGIGTYTTPEIATPMMSRFSKLLDEMIAWNLHSHVMGGYEFLMQNYSAGDRICIFGFSRGAYTARSLAGMLHKVGLLPACNHQQIPFAYKMYTTTDVKGWKQSNAFKKAFSIDVDIEFIGVWDTVSSVGLIPRRLPFTTSNTIVRTFRHAVSLDERRAKFKPNLWNRPNDHERLLSVTDQQIERHRHGGGNHAHPHANRGGMRQQMRIERHFSQDRPDETDIDEVWFAGCHCDVGGGSVDNETTTNLARIPLRWMVRECFKTNSGILFDADGLRSIGLDPDCLYPVVQPRPAPLPLDGAKIQSIPRSVAHTHEPEQPARDGALSVKSEEELDRADALAPIYDQLSLKWFWWLLELLPLRQHYQRDNDTVWATSFGMNLGQGRHVPKQAKNGVRVHRSVKMRMEAGGGSYTPHAKLDLDRVTWVD